MKGYVTSYKRMEIHDGDGIRTTVFFKGCPLRCLWCHNPESLSFKPSVATFKNKCIGCATCLSVCPEGAFTGNCNLDFTKCRLCGKCADECPTEAITIFGKETTAEEVVEAVMEDKEFYDISGGGVTLSGGECLSQSEFATDVARRLFERGVSVDIDTCGYVDFSVFEKIMPYVDTFLYDIKAFSEEVHIRCTGVSNKKILDNIKRLSDSGAKIEVRIPLVVGYNDSEIEDIGKFLAPLNIKKIKVLKYHPYAISRWGALGREYGLGDVETTSADMKAAVETLRKYHKNVINSEEGD